MEKIKLFIQNFGTLTLAGLALIQPYIVFCYRKFFKKGKIDIFKSGNIEIGYSSFGPTIGLNGTLRCLNQDFFVQSMNIDIVKEKDSSKHTFEWLLFRAQKVTLRGEEGEAEQAYSYMLDRRQPKRYNILFYDVATQKDMKVHLSNLYQSWVKSILDNKYTEDPQFNPLPYYNNEFSSAL